MVLVLVGALLGFYFAAVSTRDFAQHLDRDVHSLSCSFVPGLAKAVAGPSGCQTTMMSAYSSVLRTSVWGGLPIALPAMGVFGFLLFFALELSLARRQDDPRATGLLALATLLPALTSAVMAGISLGTLDAVCKLCLGIYLGSAIALVGGVLVWRRARARARAGEADAPILLTTRKPAEAGGEPAFLGGASAATALPALETSPISARRAAVSAPVAPGYLAAMVGLGIVLVAVPSAAYLTTAPDHASFLGACGALAAPADDYGVFVAYRARPGGVRALEVLDPLCPACRAFEERLSATGLDLELDRAAVLFPLDSTCNWMVEGATHPGACAISEAAMCAGPRAGEVIHWAFQRQESIMEAERASPGAAERQAEVAFPALAACIGSAESKARLNKALRWAVKNQLPVLTPQLYLEGVALCPEDVDLGLDFALSRMIDLARAGALASQGEGGAR